MVKQRNIFDSTRIDVLTDKTDTPEEMNSAKDLIRLHNEGVRVFGVCKSKREQISDLPLFSHGDNQTKLF